MRKFRLTIITALCAAMLLGQFCVRADFSFDLEGVIDTEVTNSKINNSKPFVEKLKINTPQFYLNDTLIVPDVRVRFNEGSGNTVTEEISGQTCSIVGSDYEWIETANIRYGGTGANKYKQTSALKLNSSYINLGDLDALADTTEDGFTLAYWANYEIFDKADNGYTEPAHLQYSGSITRGNYATAYKYDKNRFNVLLQSENTKLGLKSTNFSFNNSYSAQVPVPVMCNDFYNLYFVVVSKDDSGNWVMQLHANDRVLVSSTTAKATMENWDPANVFSGNLYIGTPSSDNTYGSPQIGIADLMIFDRPLTYQERLQIFYGYNQTGYYADNVPVK